MPVPPEISERMAVVQLDIRVRSTWLSGDFALGANCNDAVNCVRRDRFVARAGFKVVSSARRNGFVPLIAVRKATAP